MASAPREENRVPGLVAKSDADNTPVILEADQATKRLKVNATITGGGGAVTIADGADIALGTTTDVAKTADSNGTVIGFLRGLVKWAYERMPASLGQKARTASLAVTLSTEDITAITPPAAITGFATSANQTNGNQQVQGNAASGAADSGNPVKVGGKYNTTAPTLTNGQRGDLQLSPKGELSTYSPDSSVTGTITAADVVVAAPGGAGATVTGASTAGSLVALQCQGGDSSWIMQVSGTLGGSTYYFEGSLDSTTGTDGTWINLNGRQTGIVNTVLAGSTTVAGVFRGNTSGWTWIRLRAVGGSGISATVKIEVSSGTGAIFLNASIPAGSNIIGAVTVSGSANPTTPTALLNGGKKVSVTHTAVAIAVSTSCVALVITAASTNVNPIFVGNSSVTDDYFTTTSGEELQPGGSTGIAIDNLSKVFINGTANEGVSYIGS